MVKADPKHDYYADLELPSTADSDTIKKQFRLLAKQYHPDRNQGREIEVIPKFQAIQAANEILSDPVQKKRYDTERILTNTSLDTPPTHTFKKPAKPPPPPSNFPPPPKRNPNLNKPFGSNNARPTSSATAEKFAQFTRAAPQQWDRAKFEDSAKAETLRNLNNMRPQSQGPPPRPPPRAPPTAPRPPSAAPSPDVSHGPGPSPGFPGLSRTNSGRRGGFAPGTPGNDEPPAPTSAYAYVHRHDRAPPQSQGFSYPPSHNGTATSPPTQRVRPSMSPLRTTKSSGFEDAERPGLHRSSSRYASNTGERLDIKSPGLARSASVRNSPSGTRWDESGPFGGRPQSQQQRGGYKVPPPRHRSSSPRARTATGNPHFSVSETSSSEDEPSRNESRPKATPHKPRVPPSTSTRSYVESEPALTGQFPSNNYNKPNEAKYSYPAPEVNGSNHRYFPDKSNPVDDIIQGLNNAGIRHGYRDEVPVKKYESFSSLSLPSRPWISAASAKVYNKSDGLINGVPIWALPASVYPARPLTRTRAHIPDEHLKVRRKIPCNKFKTDLGNLTDSFPSQNSQHLNDTSSEQQPSANNVNVPFTAADWHGKSFEKSFQPTESTSRSRSPNKPPRPKLPNRNRGGSQNLNPGESESNTNEEAAPRTHGVRHVAGVSDGLGKAAAFQAGKSSEDWAQRLRNQSSHTSSNVPQRDQSEMYDPRKQAAAYDEVVVEEEHLPSSRRQTYPQSSSTGPDAMDVDEVPQNAPSSGVNEDGRNRSNTGPHGPPHSGVNLHELKETAPFKPTAAGLGDLGDLNDSLPFESRAAEELNLRQAPSSGSAARHLNLPAPPKPVLPPDERHLTQESWSKYSEKMTHYMDAWNIFNCKMIDHFRTRQEQISLAMYHNWVTAVGDGASADDFHGLDFIGSEVHTNGVSPTKPTKAGYATYMQWLEQDRVCRSWWDVAFDEHAACMEDLGRVRKVVKSIRAKEIQE